MQDLSAAGLKISDLGASAQMHEPDPAKRAKHMDEARRFIDLAHEMQAPYVRVFPNQFVPGEEKSVTFARISEGLHQLGEYARPADVTVIVESHGEFRRAEDLFRFSKAQNRRTSLSSGMRTIHAWKARSRQTRSTNGQVHAPHSPEGLRPVPGKSKDDRHYVLTGTGDIPVKETVRVLAKNGYKGYYCFEWEKRWHPDIDEPEVAFPQYAKTMRQYLADVGIS